MHWVFVTLSTLVFVVNWGPLLLYIILVKDNIDVLVGHAGKRCLVVTSVCVVLMCLQQDIPNLMLTSRTSILSNVTMVRIETNLSW